MLRHLFFLVLSLFLVGCVSTKTDDAQADADITQAELDVEESSDFGDAQEVVDDLGEELSLDLETDQDLLEEVAPCDPMNCPSGICDPITDSCADPACNDGLRNGTETAVDCGGSCPGCGTGAPCNQDTDCASALCDLSSLTCSLPANCTDGIQNATEEGIDCGGLCLACPGSPCELNAECESTICQLGECQPEESCSDGIHNQDETGVDCGGSCAPCSLAQGCLQSTDCEGSLVCDGVLCRYPIDCKEIRDTMDNAPSGLYTLRFAADPVEVYCEMQREGGGWLLFAHVNRSAAMPFPGRENAGDDPSNLGYSLDIDGLSFGELAVSHNGLSEADFASFQLSSPPHTFNAAMVDQVFELSDGTFAVLSLSAAAHSGSTDIASACFHADNPSCQDNSSRETAYGIVATGTGACNQLNAGDGEANCGGWGLEPYLGDTTWSATGGRLYVR